MNKTYKYVVTNKYKVFGFSSYFKLMLSLAHYYYYNKTVQWQIHLGLY